MAFGISSLSSFPQKLSKILEKFSRTTQNTAKSIVLVLLLAVPSKEALSQYINGPDTLTVAQICRYDTDALTIQTTPGILVSQDSLGTNGWSTDVFPQNGHYFAKAVNAGSSDMIAPIEGITKTVTIVSPLPLSLTDFNAHVEQEEGFLNIDFTIEQLSDVKKVDIEIASAQAGDFCVLESMDFEGETVEVPENYTVRINLEDLKSTLEANGIPAEGKQTYILRMKVENSDGTVQYPALSTVAITINRDSGTYTVHVFPNPTPAIQAIRLESNAESPVVGVRVYGLNGKSVPVTFDPDTGILRFYGNPPPGVYMVKVTFRNGKAARVRVVVAP